MSLLDTKALLSGAGFEGRVVVSGAGTYTPTTGYIFTLYIPFTESVLAAYDEHESFQETGTLVGITIPAGIPVPLLATSVQVTSGDGILIQTKDWT